MRDLTIEEETLIVKSLAISKLLHLPFLKTVSIFILDRLNVIKSSFSWQGNKPK